MDWKNKFLQVVQSIKEYISDLLKWGIDQYHELQESQQRTKDVRTLISQLGNPQTLERFDRANKSISMFKADATPKTSAAVEIRTLIDGVKGDLFNLARNWPEENMSWEVMVERLGKGDKEKQELTDQKKVYSSLVSRYTMF